MADKRNLRNEERRVSQELSKKEAEYQDRIYKGAQGARDIQNQINDLKKQKLEFESNSLSIEESLNKIQDSILGKLL
jgi:hypothetical protein